MAPRARTALLMTAAMGLAGCDAMFANPTERRTTATLRYNEVARTVEEAQAEVREMCGDAEVLSVSAPRPVTGADGEALQEVTAECRASFDARGRRI